MLRMLADQTHVWGVAVVLCGLSLGVAGAARAGVFTSIDPNDTYLRWDTTADSAGATTPIALAALGIQVGDKIQVARIGAFVGVGGGSDDQTSLCAVFSSSTTLLAPTVLNRVDDAIPDGGKSCFTAVTFPNSITTDINQDFFISGPGATPSPPVLVKVPAGATHIFVAVPDNLYSDNTDPNGDFGVDIRGLGQLPTLTEWGLVGLVLMLAGAGALAIRRLITTRATA